MCLDGVRTGAAWTGLELVLRVSGWGMTGAAWTGLEPVIIQGWDYVIKTKFHIHSSQLNQQAPHFNYDPFPNDYEQAMLSPNLRTNFVKFYFNHKGNLFTHSIVIVIYSSLS